MKCPRCGFVAHGSLEKCRQCGVRFVFRGIHDPEMGNENGWRCSLCEQGRPRGAPRFSRTVAREDAHFVILHASGALQSRGLALVALNRSPPYVLAPICSECYSFLDEMGKRRCDQARVGKVAPFIEKGASLEREGRYGEATQSYEIAGRWKDAARARPRSRGRTVRHIDANLDDLMSDLRREGLSLDYRCKACGSTWKVDGKGHDPWQKRCPKCSENIDGAILLKGLRELTS